VCDCTIKPIHPLLEFAMENINITNNPENSQFQQYSLAEPNNNKKNGVNSKNHFTVHAIFNTKIF